MVEVESLPAGNSVADAPGKKLGQLLVEQGCVTGEQVLRGILSQKNLGGRIGTCLLEMDLVTEEILTAALARQHGVPAAGVEELSAIPGAVIDLLPARVAERCQAVPFAAGVDEIHVATPNVHHLTFLDEIRCCTGRRVWPYIASEVRLHEALRRYYGVDCPSRYRQLAERLNHHRYIQHEQRARRAAKARQTEPVQGGPGQGHDVRLLAPEEVFDLPDPVSELPEDGFAVPEPPLSWLFEAGGDLSEARDASTVGAILLQAAVHTFRRAALFRIEHDAVNPWRSAGVDPDRFQAARIDLRQPSIFLQLRRGGGSHFGPLPPMPAHRQLMQAMGGGWPGECLMLPVRLGDRLVLVLYGDSGVSASGGVRVADWERLAELAGEALERCILETRRSLETERAN